MQRSKPLAADPNVTRAWQDRSKKAAAARNGGSVIAKVGAKAKRWAAGDAEFRAAVRKRDGNRCTFPHHKLGFDPPCGGPLEVQHVIKRGINAARRQDVHNGTLICRISHQWCEDNVTAARTLGLYGSANDTVRNGRVVR